jgi:hypothetical protein
MKAVRMIAFEQTEEGELVRDIMECHVRNQFDCYTKAGKFVSPIQSLFDLMISNTEKGYRTELRITELPTEV